MKNRFYKLPFLFVATIIFVNCTKEEPFNYDDLVHNSEWLFPLATTEVSADEFLALDEIEFEFIVELDPVFINPGFPTPPISGISLGPIGLEEQDSLFTRFKAEDVEVRINLVNNFPINIKAGTEIEIRNTTINNNTVFKGIIENDIAPKGGMDSIIIRQVQNNQWVDSQLEFYLNDFGSDGSSVAEDFTTFNNIAINIKVGVALINEVEFSQPISYLMTDTTELDFGDTADESAEENIQRVKMNIFLKNGIPLNFAIKAYFLDENFVVIDSLFDNALIESPSIDADGYIIPSSIVENKIEEELTQAEFINVKNKTRHIFYKLDFSSQAASSFIVESSNFIELHLTSEIETRLDL
jgi:sRNA-binding regulator protein Hfq